MLKLYTNTSTLLHKTLKTLLLNRNYRNPAIQFVLDESRGLLEDSQRFSSQNAEESPPNAEISHPWPEWVELMRKLLKDGYFNLVGNPFRSPEFGSKECNQIRTACLNFARDRFLLIRHLSSKDIQVVAGSGCPSIDRKVVNSGKRLRAHVGVDEGNVCSSCILRGSCERAYLKAHGGDGGRTVDVMRFLVAYGLDPVAGSLENKGCLSEKVKESTRNLLKEMVELSNKDVESGSVKGTSPGSHLSVQESTDVNASMKQGDWICSKCKFHNFARNIKCLCCGDLSEERLSRSRKEQETTHINAPVKQGDWICSKCNFHNFARNIKCLCCGDLPEERLESLRKEQEHLPLKKGDWICEKCNFVNFAKNTRCLQCKEKPPKRNINPGEWECESCNYINFKKNMVCLKCDHRRSKASVPVNTSFQSAKEFVRRRTRPIFGEEKQSKGGNKLWNFVDSESEDSDNTDSWNQMPQFVDFPVLGGKSELSRNMQNHERWKSEMAMGKNRAEKAKENADECKSSIMRRNYEHFQSTDNDSEEEMADWFSNRKER